MRHSERSKFNNCPFAYHLESQGLRRVTMSANAEDRTFGQAIHAALKAHYDGEEWPEIEKEYVALYPAEKEYKDKAKDFQSGIETLKAYRSYWLEQDKLWDIIGTEIADKVNFNDEDHELHIDLLARHKQTSEYWAWDHKTTNKSLGKGFWKKYELDSQITRYTKWVKDKYGSCGGFIINGIQVGHRKRMYDGEPAGYYQRFDRQPFSRNEQQIKFWEESESSWQKMIMFCETTQVWPKHLSSLCGYCDFYELCLSANNESVRETIYTTESIEELEELKIIDETK